MVNASVSLTRAKLRALQMPQQSFAVEPEATLMPQLGSADSKSCVDVPSSACLCDATRTGQLLQPSTVTPAPVDRITAAANQVADANESKNTTKSATERRSKYVFAEPADILELPHARSCCTTEACKISFSGISRLLSVTVSCTVVTP